MDRRIATLGSGSATWGQALPGGARPRLFLTPGCSADPGFGGLAAAWAGSAEYYVVLVDRELQAGRERRDCLLEAVVGELRDVATAIADHVVVMLSARVRCFVARRAVADVQAVDQA